MLKAPSWLALGLVAGAVAVFWLRPSAELPNASAGAVPPDTEQALVDRVADLEEQVKRLTLALDDFGERLSQETERANSQAAMHAAAVRELEQRLAAIAPGGFGQGVAPGSAAIPRGWVFRDRNSGEVEVLIDGAANAAGAAVTPEASAAAYAAGTPLPAPASLSDIEALPGEALIFRVTGSVDGSVWGTDSYTDDSAIAAAAVHAGVLRPGETGTMMLTLQNGLPKYAGSSRYGVDSSNFGEWERSFAIQRLQ